MSTFTGVDFWRSLPIRELNEYCDIVNEEVEKLGKC